MTLRHAIAKLAAVGIDSAKNDALSIYSHVSGRSMASLIFSLDEDISQTSHYDSFIKLIERRAAREPLQYVLGKWSFYGDDYKVSPACLIPRPETEDIVAAVLSILPKNARIADLCCGSGCIGIAVTKNSDAICTSVDISADAIEIARENALAIGVADRVSFRIADVTARPQDVELYDVIVSNPPYIRRDVIPQLEPELAYEPVIALDGGDDGMVFYRAIVKNYADTLKSDGAFVFEIGYDQADDITALAESNGFSADVKLDVENRPRTAILRRTLHNNQQ